MSSSNCLMSSRIMDHVWCASRNVETANRKDLRKDLGYSSLPVSSVHGSDVASLTARLAILRAFRMFHITLARTWVSLASADVARSSCTGATLRVGQSSPASSGHRIHRVLPCSVCNLSIHCHFPEESQRYLQRNHAGHLTSMRVTWDLTFMPRQQLIHPPCTIKKQQATQCLVGNDDRYTDS